MISLWNPQIPHATMYTTNYIIIIIQMYIKIPKNIGITEFRKKLSTYFEKAINGDPVVVSNENIQAILINLETYNNLVEHYQDKKDSEVLIKSIIKNKRTARIPWQQIKPNIKK